MRQFAVIGLGRFGANLARTLYELGCDVMGVDSDEARIQDLVNEVTHVVQADSTDEDALRNLGLRNFDVVVVAIGNDIHASVLTTLMVKEMGVKEVVAKASSELHGKLLQKIGADRVVYPERDMGIRVAHNLVSSDILDYIELDPDYSVVEMAASPSVIGKALRELDLRGKYGISGIAIKKDDSINVAPGPDDVVEDGSVLVMIGSNRNLAAYQKARGQA